MPSFHDMWMDAWHELHDADAISDMTPAEWHEYRGMLSEARELIDEDNSFAERREGGGLIRRVRLRCREARERTTA
jgi:hypothetical protein